MKLLTNDIWLSGIQKDKMIHAFLNIEEKGQIYWDTECMYIVSGVVELGMYIHLYRMRDSLTFDMSRACIKPSFKVPNKDKSMNFLIKHS